MSSFQQQRLVQCPKCNCSVRSDRLKSHIQKVHQAQQFSTEEPTKKKLKSPGSLTAEKFKQVSALINSWLYRYKDNLYNSNNVRNLTIMALESTMGYSFDEINKLHGGKIDRNQYERATKRLKITFEQMMDRLHQRLIRYSKHYIDQKTRNQYYAQDDEDSYDYADWYACNSVDRMDGSKYIGYHHREYEDSRFGSFPVHDDYSEESWADDNPWE